MDHRAEALDRQVHGAVQPVFEGTGGIDALCAAIDGHGEELECDFQRFYGLDLNDRRAWTPRSVSHALTLIRGLMDEPWSRYRASMLREHPPRATADAPSWLGWSPEVERLNSMLGQMIADAYAQGGKKAPSGSLPKTPLDQRHTARPATIRGLVTALDIAGVPHT